MNVYRYTTLEYFREMVENSVLILVDPFRCWEDTYEGFFYSVLKDHKIFDALVNKTSHKNDPEKELDRLRVLLRNSAKGLYAQSWSRNGDTMQMWSAYSHDQAAIMIQSNLNQLDAVVNYNKQIAVSDHPNGTIGISLDNVNYDLNDDDDVYEYVLSLFEKTNILIHPYDPLLHKRVSFVYENEVRLFATNLNATSKVVPLLVKDISSFITGVMVHPSANDTLLCDVRKVCDDNGIPFLGKVLSVSKGAAHRKIIECGL